MAKAIGKCARGSLIVVGDERVVKDERGAALLGDQADELDPRGQVDLVDRSLAEALDGHPVADLG